MEQEAADELLGGDGGDGVAGFSVSVPGGFAIPERDVVCIEAGDAAVADGDPVGASGEVAEDLLGVAERRFSILPIISNSRCATRTIRYLDKRPMCFARRLTTENAFFE